MRALAIALSAALAAAAGFGCAGASPRPGARSAVPAPPAGPVAVSAVSGLPIPPGGGVPRPAGAPGTLTILNWAGFKAAASWTFDDSLRSQIEHYPELRATGVPSTFYITTGNATGPAYDATWTQAVRDGSEIGNHTVHHCHANLTGCGFGAGAPFSTLGEELDQCSAAITHRYPQAAVWTAASPYGDRGYDASAPERFLVNRGVQPGMVAPNDDTDPYNLPCYAAVRADTAARFDEVTDAARAAGKWTIFLIHAITPTTENGYAPVAIDQITAGMSYGRALGDVWMATVANVAAYWRAQKLLSGVAPATSGRTTTWTWALPPQFPRGKYLRAKVDGGTLAQRGQPLVWDDHGYYEVALDAGSLTLAP
jgi:peptidoglycan/xylan/chitin deacetylase (PgdA/CDA1 family)